MCIFSKPLYEAVQLSLQCNVQLYSIDYCDVFIDACREVDSGRRAVIVLAFSRQQFTAQTINANIVST